MPRLSEIDDLRILDATGRCLGRVHDLRTHGGGGDDRFDVATVLYAGAGLLERLGLGHDRRDRLPWNRVDRIADVALMLKDELPPS